MADSTGADPKWQASLRRRLIAWYRRHARDLPWRRTRDPYAIWISETMLQQTQVATVIPYYERFLQKFPTISALAQASEASVLREWEGLGYYRRARQLHAAAQVMMADFGGQFPQQQEQVQSLPGVGRYTAGAVVSFAYDQRAPIVEANTLRVYCRLLAYRADPRSAAGQRLLWQTAESWLPRRHAGEFNQALMELGGTVCKIREPDCEACPLRVMCPTRARGWQAKIPAPPKAARFESIREAAVVVRRAQQVLLLRRAEGERWAGLWDFPRFSISAATGARLRRELQGKLRQTTGVEAALGERIATLKHGVTRFRISLECFAAEPQGSLPPARAGTSPSRPSSQKTPFAADSEVRWVEIGDLEAYALPVTGRKLARLLV